MAAASKQRMERGSSRKEKREREREVHWNELFPIKATMLVGKLIIVFILNERSLFSGVVISDNT
jgi:hypothetical protein